MNTRDIYNLWLKKAKEDEDLVKDLENIKNNDKEISDRFYKNLTFGTAGLRGLLGAGTNRMNIYTVRQATKGLADYLNSHGKKSCVAISFDSRIKSELFAREAAKTLAANNIKAYIVKELSPVPFLSFAVRHLSADAGIMITASHNSFQYNGYKCYGADGSQLTEVAADKVYELIKKVDAFNVEVENFEEAIKNKQIAFIDDSVVNKYLEAVQKQCINPQMCKDSNLKVVYTPLNGAGNKFVKSALKRVGITNVVLVKEQEMPDGNFTTCKFPNPELKQALTLALKLAEKENADLVIATDPDSDRVGVAAKQSEKFKIFTGNEIGIMLMEYILSQKRANGLLPKKPVVIKTIVSTDLAGKIANKYGCELREVLTGFKYIGEQILNLEKYSEENRFVFGFEESHGYLSGSYVRDKDGVAAAMLICEVAAFCKLKNKSLPDFINELYEEYGFYQNAVLNYDFTDSAVFEKMQSVMESLRKIPIKKISDYKIEKFIDYNLPKETDVSTLNKEKINLPKSNVLSYLLEGDNKVIIRPSGTEPKIKVYITAKGESNEKAQEIISKLLESILKILETQVAKV